ncbi:hypothetical protein [Thiobacillus denitrificans]|uniref:hypothetical protein n=1 Tax=Thiobacillus denitrificans TaxID=36861 RepID=UPI000364E280|nr:hypothetical protein [Thiobacillus denitrificans]
MPSSTAAVWPSPGRFALALLIGLAVTLAAAWAGGESLIENLLPATRIVLGWIDDRFGILFLGVEHNWQDTVVRLRVNVVDHFVMGGQVIEPQSDGWLEVTTTTGAMLQPLVIAPALALALPARIHVRAAVFALAALFAAAFLVVDLPLTLHAYVWDIFIDNLEPERFSMLMAWHEFMHAGGRLGVAVILGVAGWWLVQRKAA